MLVFTDCFRETLYKEHFFVTKIHKRDSKIVENADIIGFQDLCIIVKIYT